MFKLQRISLRFAFLFVMLFGLVFIFFEQAQAKPYCYHTCERLPDNSFYICEMEYQASSQSCQRTQRPCEIVYYYWCPWVVF